MAREEREQRESPPGGATGGAPAADLAAEVARLRAENATLRAALADGASVDHQRILEGIPAPVFITTVGTDEAPSRRILLANRAALALLGASDEHELAGKDLLEFVHPDDRGEALERGVRARRGLPIAPVSQGRMRRFDGSEVTVERSVTQGILRGQQVLQSVVYDVSDRVRMEAALHRSEARFRGLAENSLLGIAVVTAEEPGRIMYCNLAFNRMFGFAEDEDLSGLEHLDLLVPPNERPRIDAYRAARRAGQPAPVQFEYEARRVDGERIVVNMHVTALEQDWGGEPVLMLVYLDVTSQRLAERALRESEQRFRDFAEAASDWYWETGPDLAFTYVSERFEAVTGVSSVEVLGRLRAAALPGREPPPDSPDADRWQPLAETIDAHRPWRDFSYRWLDHAGVMRTLSSSAVPVFDRDGDFRGYRGIGRDVTAEASAIEALEAERARLERAEQSALLGSWYLDVDSGEMVWSPGMYRICRVDPDTFVPSEASATALHHPDDRAAVAETLRESVRAGSAFSYAARIVCPDDAVRTVEVVGECDRAEDGRARVVVGVMQDVSERDRAETLLRDAVRSIPDGFAIYDADDRLTLCNDAYRDLVPEVASMIEPGCRYRDVVARCVARGVFADVGADETAWLDRRMAEHRTPGAPVEWRLGDGQVLRVVQRRTREGGTVVIQIDVTEARRAEGLLRDAIDGMPFGFLIWDADDRLVLANEAFESTEPVSGSDVFPGARFEDVMTARVRLGLLADAAGREEAYIRERLVQHRNPTGEPIEQQFADGRWIELRESRTREGGVLGFRTDITERKRTERELEEHRERLQELVAERTRDLAEAQGELLRAERFAAIGQLTAAISHELRNPLGTLSASFHVLADRLPGDDASVRRVLARIDRSIGRCVFIIEELLDYTRERPLALEKRRIGDWCESVVERIERPDTVRLELDVRANPEVAFDVGRLARALGSVVDNAWQALQAAGEGGLPAGVVRVAVRERGAEVSIDVEDDGPGIPEDERARVFEPLFSTKFFGVGLGLPLARQVMELHGGGVEIGVAPTGGARVTLRLPTGGGGTIAAPRGSPRR